MLLIDILFILILISVLNLGLYGLFINTEKLQSVSIFLFYVGVIFAVAMLFSAMLIRGGLIYV